MVMYLQLPVMGTRCCELSAPRFERDSIPDSLLAGEKPAYRLYRSMPARTSPGVDVKESFGEKLDSVVYFLGRDRGLWS